jgi:hypothetical protein
MSYSFAPEDVDTCAAGIGLLVALKHLPPVMVRRAARNEAVACIDIMRATYRANDAEKEPTITAGTLRLTAAASRMYLRRYAK